MAGVAIAQVARREVEDADEERDEDVGLIVAAGRLVEQPHDVGRVVLARCDVSEDCLRDGHDECGGNALAAHVANAEEELAVAHEGVVEVAAHGLCRDEPPLDLDVADALQEHVLLGQQGLLYVACDAQLARQAFLLQSLLPQFLFAFGKAPYHVEQDAECEEREQQQAIPEPQQRAIDLVVVADDGYLPVRLALHVDIEDGAVALSPVEVDDFASPFAAWAALDGTVVDERRDELHFLVQAGVVRAGYVLAILGEQEVERGRVDVAVVECVAEVFCVDIDAEHRHRVARELIDGHGIADESLPEVHIVVRPHPAVVVLLHDVAEEAVLRVVERAVGHLQALDAAVGLQGVWFEEPPLVGIIIGDEGDAAALQIRGVLGDLLQDAGHRVGEGQVAFHLHDVALQCVLRVLDDALHDDGLRRQLHLGILLQLVLHQVVRKIVLRTGQQFEHQDRQDDNQQRASVPERPDKVLQPIHACRGPMPAAPARRLSVRLDARTSGDD